MIQSILNALFGCSHRRTTFPLTPGRHTAGSFTTASAARHGTYVVCLDCGKEFGYNWQDMCVGEPVTTSRDLAPATQTYYTVNH